MKEHTLANVNHQVVLLILVQSCHILHNTLNFADTAASILHKFSNLIHAWRILSAEEVRGLMEAAPKMEELSIGNEKQCEGVYKEALYSVLLIPVSFLLVCRKAQTSHSANDYLYKAIVT